MTSAFARAKCAIDDQRVDALRAELAEHPEIVREHGGTNANNLLGMAAATCDERLVALLLEHGADPAATNVHGWTALHQAAYAGLPALARMLLDAGAPADTSARGDGGTPLIVALFWGHRAVAELLAEQTPAPANLRVAAGLGLPDLLDELISPDGRLAAAAGAHRAYHRPHSGFPAWQPSNDPAEIRDEALTWAARNDRVTAVRTLAQRGATIDADVYRGTALAWAAATGSVHALRALLDLGADPNARTTFGGPDHGEQTTALHLAAQNGHLEAITLLLSAGASPTARDALHHSTPADWADYGEHPAAAELLRS